ncbi:MAG: hypothetical protein IJ551_08395 [Prevotella sp.]|nr:hypothetical protein [Prevotella sp.]
MRKDLLWMVLAVVLGAFTLSALTACGGEDDDEATREYEVNIVGVLPQAVAPYAMLELTYNDAQGNQQRVVLKAGDTSQPLPAYVSKTSMLMTLGSVDFSKCVVCHRKFSMTGGGKVTCKYRIVGSGVPVKAAPAEAYCEPFAFVMTRQVGTESLVLPQNMGGNTYTGSNQAVFKSQLERWNGKEAESTVLF